MVRAIPAVRGRHCCIAAPFRSIPVLPAESAPPVDCRSRWVMCAGISARSRWFRASGLCPYCSRLFVGDHFGHRVESHQIGADAKAGDDAARGLGRHGMQAALVDMLICTSTTGGLNERRQLRSASQVINCQNRSAFRQRCCRCRCGRCCSRAGRRHSCRSCRHLRHRGSLSRPGAHRGSFADRRCLLQ